MWGKHPSSTPPRLSDHMRSLKNTIADLMSMTLKYRGGKTKSTRYFYIVALVPSMWCSNTCDTSNKLKNNNIKNNNYIFPVRRLGVFRDDLMIAC
jgi:hypothetical protein